MKFPFLVLLLFSSVFCFSQKEPIIIYDGTPDDSLEFEGNAINLHIELIFIKKITGKDTVYYDFNELEDVYFSCARYVNDTSLYYYPENNYVVLEIDYNDFCLITFYAKGFNKKSIIIDTKQCEKYEFGYLFPCQIRFYKNGIFSKKQKEIPYISFNPVSKYLEFIMIGKKDIFE